jgi:hypothetical protein
MVSSLLRSLLPDRLAFMERHLRCIYLCGSHAGGYAIRGSDIDVKVITRAGHDLRYLRTRALEAIEALSHTEGLDGLAVGWLPEDVLRAKPRFDLTSAALLWGEDIRQTLPAGTVSDYLAEVSAAVERKFLPGVAADWRRGPLRPVVNTGLWIAASELAARHQVIPRHKLECVREYTSRNLPDADLVIWLFEELRGRYGYQAPVAGISDYDVWKPRFDAYVAEHQTRR